MERSMSGSGTRGWGALSVALVAVACGGEGNAPAPGATGDAGATPLGCVPASVQADVADIDLAGYPPYAVDGCRLVFVAGPAHAAPGSLVLRNLDDASETILAAAAEEPRRPAIAADVVAWEATVGGSSAVKVHTAGATHTLTGSFVSAGEPRVAAGRVVFAAWLSADPDGDTDVLLYDVGTGSTRAVGSGAGQQRFADVSATHVAYTDFSEDASGVYDPAGIALADVVLVNLADDTRVVVARPFKQAYPMLGADGRLVYLEWPDTARPVPKLEGFSLRALDLAAPLAEPVTLGDVTTDPPSIRPAAFGGLVEWVERQGGVSRLVRVDAAGGSEPTTVAGLEGLDLFAPAATTDLTVLATRGSVPGVSLRGVSR